MSEYQKAIIAKQSNNWNELYHSLQALATMPLEKNELEGVLNLIEDSLLEEDFQARWDLLKILPKFGTAIINPLIKLLEDPDQEVEVRWFIIKALSEFQTPEVILSLSKLLQTTEEDSLLEAASQALAQIGHSSIEKLVELQAQENLRGFVIEALSRIPHIEVIPYLREAYQDPSPQIRHKAIEALGSFPEAQLIPLFLQALQDTWAPVRKQALVGLKYWCHQEQQEDLLSAIKPLLYDLNQEVCQQAIFNLALLGGIIATTELGKLLKSEQTPPELKQDVIRALSWMETELALKRLLDSLLTQNDPLILKEIITVLGRLKNQPLQLQAIKTLEDFYHSGLSEDLKVTMAVSLGELGRPESLKVLKLLKQDPEVRVRLHAIAALKKLSY